MYEAINKGLYDFPSKPKKPKSECKNGHFFFFRDIPMFCNKCGVSVRDDYETKIKEYRKQLDDYMTKCNEIHEKFKHDALEYCGIFGHEKADKAFEIAWDYGHSNGYNEVLIYLADLADLLI